MKGLIIGEKVMAKWPGSYYWFPAVITAVGEDEESYMVKFDDYDGFEDEFAENHVTRASSFRRSRSKSPSRRRSRSRSPARRASPSRSQARSPSRKVVQEQATPNGTQTEVSTGEEKTAQSSTRRTVTISSSYTTRSVTRSSGQTLKPTVNVKFDKVPKTTQYALGGPIGAFITMLCLPILAFYLHFACGEAMCELAYPTIISLDWHDYYDTTAYQIVLGWFLFQVVLHLIPVGREVRGMPLRNGSQLKYRLNGFLNGLLCLAVFLSMVYFKCGVDMIFDKFLPMCVCAMLCALVLSVAFYMLARRAPGNALAPKGNTGNVLYDFFVGHELNPRPLWNIDMKLYIFRAAVIAWALIDISFLVKAWADFPDNPPYPMLCVVFFQLLQICQALVYEETWLTAIDVQHQGLGYFGTYIYFVYIPFVYTMQARYLVSHSPTTMPLWGLVPMALLNVVGFIIYRHANIMKCYFRRNPNADLTNIPTSSGKGLLTAGWWGLVRKPNYLGDLMMALSWSLYCGFDSALPYFYPIFLTLVLIMREREDSKSCWAKYRAAWDQYCKRVPYRIIPYIY